MSSPHALSVFVLCALAAAPRAWAQSPGSPSVEPPSNEAPSLEARALEARATASVQERNKALARGFYEDLWFSDRTDRYAEYVADEYVVHDIGDRKGVVEPAIEQKHIADFLHSQGEMTGSIDFQIAEGDLVATRWQWQMKPTSLLFRALGGAPRLPIINVFRFDADGRIVEIWNHRHDIDSGFGNIPFVQGLGAGLAVALVGWITAAVLWRRLRKATRTMS